MLFGVLEPGGAAQAIATIPEFFWELSLGIYLTVKGFRPSPILPPDARPVRPQAPDVAILAVGD